MVAFSLENRSTLTIFLSISLFISVILISNRRYVQHSIDDFFPPIRLTAATPPQQPRSSVPDISREPKPAVIDEETELPPASVGEKKNVEPVVDDYVQHKDATEEMEKVVRESLKDCNLYMGSWVRDESYPIYKAGSCPFVDEAFDCQANGRPDSDYLRWRWKPHGCHLPRFNSTDFLERLRGKNLLLVGDSVNRNQFESILCLLREGLPDKTRMHEIHGHRITKGRGSYVFKFLDYNCSVEYALSHYLVKEGVRINGQGNSNPTLSIDRVDKTSKKWKRADIIVFNTGHWWSHRKTSRGVNYYKEGEYIHPHLDANEAYRRSLQTWGKWIDKNLNATRQLVFYRGYSTPHFRGGEWDSGGSCYNEKEPIQSDGEAIVKSYPGKMKIVEEVIKGMKFPVRLLNVTRLTNYRKDGHPSVYRKNSSSSKRKVQDCSHWCLPGVPDAWNELIYANLFLK